MDKNQLTTLAEKLRGTVSSREGAILGAHLAAIRSAESTLDLTTRTLHLSVARQLHARPVTLSPGKRMGFKALYVGQPFPSRLKDIMSPLDWNLTEEDRQCYEIPSWKFTIEIDPDQPAGYSSEVHAWSLLEAKVEICKELLNELPDRVSLGEKYMIIDLWNPEGDSVISNELLTIKNHGS